MHIVNKIFPVPDQQLMISIPSSKNTDQTVHWQRLIKHSHTFFSWPGSIITDRDITEQIEKLVLSPVHPLESSLCCKTKLFQTVSLLGQL